MFFSKPLKQVTYDDVLQFCDQKIKENEVLDYKEDFPSKLEKVIAAFANTYGGLIIIGVPEVDGKPANNPKGVEFLEGLEEKVTSIILSNISPPVFPEIQVCEPKDRKTFVLIQVPQSSNTPHSVENNTKVYLRTGNIMQSERLADLDELHWLSRNRESSISLRHELINELSNRYFNLCQLKKAKVNFAELMMFVVPLYPSSVSSNASIKEIKGGIHDLTVSDRTGATFPSINKARIETMKDGLYLFSNVKSGMNEFTEYTALNNVGLTMHFEDLGRLGEETSGESPKQIFLSNVIYLFVNLLKFYRKITPILKVAGDYKVRLSLLKMLGVIPLPLGYNNLFRELPEPYYDKLYHYESNISSTELDNEDSLKQIAFDFTDNLHWSFGYPLEEKVYKEWLEKNITWEN